MCFGKQDRLLGQQHYRMTVVDMSASFEQRHKEHLINWMSPALQAIDGEAIALAQLLL